MRFPNVQLDEGWEVSTFVIVDDVEDLDALTPEHRKIARSLAVIYRNVGIRGIANWKGGTKTSPRDFLDIVVTVFDDVESCRRQWDAKYESNGFEDEFTKHVEKNHTYLDRRDLNMRLIRVRNAWISTCQTSNGEMHIRIGAELLAQCTQTAKEGP
ncbi:hypothetical protein Enr13x_43240 [Stieleria neptunia]|uniref:Uncharacterized protein n=2 Tax=Stieleria neptunia TaxID=2527979 RepID=A0A518HUC2_9BACT|nr:hypothetical protein Enr13x_43240 [Stieleria neptunia]